MHLTRINPNARNAFRTRKFEEDAGDLLNWPSSTGTISGNTSFLFPHSTEPWMIGLWHHDIEGTQDNGLFGTNIGQTEFGMWHRKQVSNGYLRLDYNQTNAIVTEPMQSYGEWKFSSAFCDGNGEMFIRGFNLLTGEVLSAQETHTADNSITGNYLSWGRQIGSTKETGDELGTGVIIHGLDFTDPTRTLNLALKPFPFLDRHWEKVHLLLSMETGKDYSSYHNHHELTTSTSTVTGSYVPYIDYTPLGKRVWSFGTSGTPVSQTQTTEVESLSATTQTETTETESSGQALQTETTEAESLSAALQTETTEVESISATTQSETSECESLSATTQTEATELESQGAISQPETTELESLSAVTQPETTETEGLQATTQTETTETESLSAVTQTETTETESKAVGTLVTQTETTECESKSITTSTEQTEVESKGPAVQTEQTETESLAAATQTETTDTESLSAVTQTETTETENKAVAGLVVSTQTTEVESRGAVSNTETSETEAKGLITQTETSEAESLAVALGVETSEVESLLVALATETTQTESLLNPAASLIQLVDREKVVFNYKRQTAIEFDYDRRKKVEFLDIQ